MIKERTGLEAALVQGSSGQFDVVLEGETLASRQGGLLNKLTGGGWPDPDDVVDELVRRGVAADAG